MTLGIAGIFGFRILSPNSIPQEFIDARIQGAIISQNIVNLSNQSADDLDKISKLETQGDLTGATNAALEAIERSKGIRTQAVELSNQVSKMTASLSDISSFEARQAALEAISNRLALISRLINYSDYLNQLLVALETKFSGKSGKKEIEKLLSQINAEVTAVNNFDRQATQDMNRFDAIVNGR